MRRDGKVAGVDRYLLFLGFGMTRERRRAGGVELASRWFFLLWGTHAPGPQSEGKIQILDQGFELADVAQGKRNAGRRLVVTRRKRRRSRLGAAVAAIKIKLRVSNELGVCFLESPDWKLYSAPSHPLAAVRFANEVRRTRDPRLVRSCLPRVGATFALGAWEVSAADPPGETKRARSQSGTPNCGGQAAAGQDAAAFFSSIRCAASLRAGLHSAGSKTRVRTWVVENRSLRYRSHWTGTTCNRAL